MPMLKWHERPSDQEVDDFSTDSAAYSVSRGRSRQLERITATDVFLRESLQNSKDQRSESSDIARVIVTARRLGGAEAKRFAAFTDLRLVKQHYQAVTEMLQRTASPSRGEFPAFRGNLDDFSVLAVEDFGTRGLNGPERRSDVTATTNSANNYVLLLRSRGATEDVPVERGGTHGYGKNVYWSASALRVCFFYSQYTDEDGRIRQRVVGSTRTITHILNGVTYGWAMFWGGVTPEGGSTGLSVVGTDLRAIARDLGLMERDPRRVEDCGTSALVVCPQFRNGGDEDDTGSTEPLSGHALRASVARYWWPALTAWPGAPKRLHVEVQGIDEAAPAAVSVSEYPELTRFVQAVTCEAPSDSWTLLDQSDVHVRDIPGTKVPRDQAHRGRIRCILSRAPVGSALGQHVALIRGSRMVVGYYRLKHSTGAAAQAVALCGSAVENADAPVAQQVLEEWLKRSEFSSHDEWSAASPNLADCYGRIAQLSEIEERIFGRLRDAMEVPPTSAAGTFQRLSRLLALDKGTGAPSARPAQSRILFDDGWGALGDADYGAEIVVHLSPAVRGALAEQQAFRVTISGFCRDDHGASAASLPVVAERCEDMAGRPVEVDSATVQDAIVLLGFLDSEDRSIRTTVRIPGSAPLRSQGIEPALDVRVELS